MAVHTLASLTKELDVYIRKVYLQRLTEVPPEYTAYTKAEAWDKNGDRFAPFLRGYQVPGALPAQEFPEHTPIPQQDLREGRSKDVYPVRFGTSLSFSYQKIKMGSGIYNSARRAAELLADSYRMTVEAYWGALLGEATNPSAPPELLGFDGKPLCSTSHVLLNGQTVSNLATTASDPTYTTLNTVITAVARTVNEDGNPYPIFRVNTLFVPPELEQPAYEAIKSSGRPDTANRADNVIRYRLNTTLTQDSVVTLLWIPPTHWFAADSARHSLTRYVLEDQAITGPYVDEKTHDHTWQLTFWIGRTFWDWRGIYGVPKP
jgi:hypothetical protein